MGGSAHGAGELTLEEYFRRASRTDRFKTDKDRKRYYALGLTGEIGGLLSEFKKKKRDELSEQDRTFAEEELGDAVWYLLHAADGDGIKPRALGRASIERLERNYGVSRGTKSVPGFLTIDRMASAIARVPPIQTLLASLARECGALMESGPALRPQRLERYASPLSTLALLARRWGLSLDKAANQNLDKIKGRWPGPRPRYVPLFDEDYEPHEQLPRSFTVEFVERKRNGNAHVVQTINEIAIGDPLTDNNDEDDGYRYHDVFHFAYAVHLGWSPVIRALLKRKRKSNPKVDTNQDGARAIIIEEGIATWIFNFAPHKWFAGISEGDLDFSLLKQVRKIVRGYEVEICPAWQWERAILSGMQTFKQLYENEGGLVTVDLGRRTLTYAPLKIRAGRR